MSQNYPPGYFQPGPYTGPGNYAANAPIAQSGGGLFGSISAGQQPYLGGSPMALDTYLNGVQGQQSGLQNAATNARLEPVAAPQANYGSNAGPGSLAVGADQLAQQGQAAYGTAQGAYGAANNALAQQQRATGLAAAAAAGQTPSAAELQQGAGISQALRSQLAAAASTRGGAAQQAAAGQQAAMQGAQLQAQGISQNAQLRAQEMATARAQYLGATQANTGAAQGQTQAAQGLAGMSLQQQAQAAAQAQYQAGNQLQQNQLNNNLSLGLGQQALGYGQLGLSAQQSQLAAATAQNQANLQATQAANQSNTQFATGIIGGLGGILGALSDVRAKQNVQPAAGGQPAQPPAWQTAMRQAQAQDPAGSVAAPVQAAQPTPPPVVGMTKDQALAFLKGQPMPDAQPVGYTMPPPVTSDKDTKAGAKDSQHVADAYLDELAKSASTYSYKDPTQAPAARPPGARFGGVMAQDLEQVPEIGHQLVGEGPQGKVLEGGANLSAALMGLGRLHERLKALEAARGAR